MYVNPRNDDAGEYKADARDIAEQALMARWLTEPDFAHECAMMTDAQWDAYLNEVCGPRPGAKKDEHRAPKTTAPEGYETVIDCAARMGVPVYTVRNWIGHGYVIGGERRKLRSERVGRLVVVRPEWVEELLSQVPERARAGLEETRAKHCGGAVGVVE